MMFSSNLGFTSVLLFSLLLSLANAGNLYQDIDITWGGDHGKVLNNGQLVTLSLDRSSGSGFQSKNQYLFGRFDMQIKLVPGNSAGTVATFYLSSQGSTHDEIDFEFLGNLSGDPYTVHTNVYAQGKGDREMQFKLWFDPTKDFHIYSVLWNPSNIVFYVDGTPLREFKNKESIGVSFPNNQQMRVYASVWDAEDWATRGGQVKTDWSQAPFTASYSNFSANGCTSSDTNACSKANSTWMFQQVDSMGQQRMMWAQKNYMIYNYCTDVRRFPQGLAPECSSN